MSNKPKGEVREKGGSWTKGRGGRRGGDPDCEQAEYVNKSSALLLPEHCLKAYRGPLRWVILALIPTPEWVASQNAPGHENDAFASTKLLKGFHTIR